ncbi:MAG: hypothetical protein ACW98A_10330 [Candidatus Hodarchaeales archaeon]
MLLPKEMVSTLPSSIPMTERELSKEAVIPPIISSADLVVDEDYILVYLIIGIVLLRKTVLLIIIDLVGIITGDLMVNSYL